MCHDDKECVEGQPTRGLVADNLVKFARLLRHQGVRVSSAEISDALAAIGAVPLLDKAACRTALRSTLVKDEANLPVFERTFNVFFASPGKKAELFQQSQELQLNAEQQVKQAEEELVFQGHSLDLPLEDKLLYGHLQPEQRVRVQDFLQKTSEGKNVGPKFEPVVLDLVRQHLAYWRQRLEAVPLVPSQVSTGYADLDQLLEGIRADSALDQARLLDRDLNGISEQDLPVMGRLIRRLARKLATAVSRRYRQSNRPARIDLRRSIRANLGRGGTMMVLKYRQKKLRKPRLVLVADVSGSMARYSTFVLQFIYGLAEALPDIESFVFAEELERITGFFRHHQPFEATMSKIVGQSRVWGEGTNLFRALVTLQKGYPALLTPNTVLLILSDTKTLALEQAAAEMAGVRRRVREVLWLNTLPSAEWPRHRTVEAFQPYSRMVECNTLHHLEVILRQELLG